MIRAATAADHDAVMSIVRAINLFPPDEVDDIDEMLSDHFAGGLDAENHWLVDFCGEVPVALRITPPSE
jgi:hypothetical protein